MADIFLSYAREDIEKAQLLAEALQAHGWSVFWDRSSILPGEDFEEVIENAIKEAYCVIVAWSGESRRSNWVRGEANIGFKQKKLVPILLAEIDPPLSFNSIHTEDFTLWNGNSDDSVFQKLISAVSVLVKPDNMNKRGTSNTQNLPNLSPLIIPKMVIIPEGTFEMGSNENDAEKPVHTVTLKKQFALGRYPVTFDEYDYYVDQTGVRRPFDGNWGRGARPVIDVSWNDAVGYAEWLSSQTDRQYRLPTEAEWEYAVRAGSTGDYYWSNSTLKGCAWFDDNSGERTQPVGEKQPNAFGLYDMSGNVLEWVQDCWHDNYQNAPGDGSAWDQAEINDCSKRVLRGGAFDCLVSDLRSASRFCYRPKSCLIWIGFRLAQDLP